MRRARAVAVGCGLAALAGASVREAHAVDILTLLDWTCAKGNRANTEPTIKSEMLGACGMTEVPNGVRYQICSIFKGTPYACYDWDVSSHTYDCQYGKESITVSAETGSTLGWRVEGTLTVSAEYVVDFIGGECDLSDKDPTPTAQGGDFVTRRGRVRVHAIFKAEGTGKVKFLGGTVMSVDATASCNDQLKVAAYERDSVEGCTKSTCLGSQAHDDAAVATALPETNPLAHAAAAVCEEDPEPPVAAEEPEAGEEPMPWPGTEHLPPPDDTSDAPSTLDEEEDDDEDDEEVDDLDEPGPVPVPVPAA